MWCHTVFSWVALLIIKLYSKLRIVINEIGGAMDFREQGAYVQLDPQALNRALAEYDQRRGHPHNGPRPQYSDVIIVNDTRTAVSIEAAVSDSIGSYIYVVLRAQIGHTAHFFPVDQLRGSGEWLAPVMSYSAIDTGGTLTVNVGIRGSRRMD
jgi:hypothetical protein